VSCNDGGALEASAVCACSGQCSTGCCCSDGTVSPGYCGGRSLCQQDGLGVCL
jgi:hypothetical protein